MLGRFKDRFINDLVINNLLVVCVKLLGFLLFLVIRGISDFWKLNVVE